MDKVHIDKFIDGEHQKSFSVPYILVDVADRVLPRAAIDALVKRGIDIVAITAAKRQGGSYSRSVDVVEGGVKKKVFVSLNDRHIGA